MKIINLGYFVMVLILYAMIALTITFAKAAVSAADPLFFIAVRMLIAGGLLLGFYQLFRKKHAVQGSVTLNDVVNFALVVIFHIYLAFIPEFWSLQYLPSVKANILWSMTPFVAMLLSFIVYGERITRLQLIGSLIAFFSLMPLLVHGYSWCMHDMFSFSLPEMMLIISVFSATYAWFIIKKLMDRGYSLLTINGFAMLFGGVMSFATWLFMRTPGSVTVTSYGPFLFTLFGLILLSNVIVYNLYGWLLKNYSINMVTIAGFMSPVFGALFGWFFFGEQFALHDAVAVSGIAIGLALFFMSARSAE
jgi:drug/metabolite transporter (DMT)-like permease